MEDESEVDAAIALYLFSDQPVAVRLRRMRQLLAAGVDAHELRTLDDLRNDLAKANDSVWDARRPKRRRAAPRSPSRATRSKSVGVA